MITKKQGMMGVDGLTMVTAKLDALAHELKKMNVNVVSAASTCELCKGEHGTNECALIQNVESANYVQNRGNSYGDSYNPSWRNHPNFSWKNQAEQAQVRQPPGFGSSTFPNLHQPAQQDKNLSLEGKLDKFMDMMDKKMTCYEDFNRKLEARVEQIQKDTQLMFKTHSSSIHNLEVQLG